MPSRLRPILRNLCYRLTHPRKLHVYCVGAAKTGTNSIANLFHAHYHVMHEPGSRAFIETVLGFREGRLPASDVARVLKRRDRIYRLDVEASHYLYYFVDRLVELFNDARFILTIRDCYSWADSFINHQLARPASAIWRTYRDVRFQAGRFQHSEKERPLAERGLYTLDGYFAYWAEHNHRVLAAVPEDRLLVVRTHEIGQSLPKIAEFVGVALETLDPQKAHSFKAAATFGLLNQIDESWLREKGDLHCKPLMDRFFPEIQSPGDALGLGDSRAGEEDRAPGPGRHRHVP